METKQDFSFEKDIKKRYKHKPYYTKKYLSKYGSHLVVSVVAILIVVGIVLKLMIEGEIYKYKKQWNELRCKPQWIPFAHYISPVSDKSPEEINAENMSYCASKVLEGVTESATAPARAAIAQTSAIQEKLLEIQNFFRKVLAELKARFEEIFGVFSNILMAASIPIYTFIVKLKQVFLRLNGVMASVFYVFVQIYVVVKNGLIIVTNFLFWTIVALIITLWLLIALSVWWLPLLMITVPLSIFVIYILVVSAIIYGEVAPIESRMGKPGQEPPEGGVEQNPDKNTRG